MNKNSTPSPLEKRKSTILLKQAFLARGYLRLPNLTKRKSLKEKYKKGYEIRFVTSTKKELAHLRKAIKILGYKPSKVFIKNNQWVQPLYNKTLVLKFSKYL